MTHETTYFNGSMGAIPKNRLSSGTASFNIVVHSPRLPRPREVVLLWGSLTSCVPVGNRHARRLPIAAQDAILPH